MPIQRATLLEPDQKTPEISTEELRTILATKSATVFDARPFNEYAVSHISGAVNVSAKPGVSISLYVSDVVEVGRVVGDDKLAPIVLYLQWSVLRQKQAPGGRTAGRRLHSGAALPTGYPCMACARRRYANRV